MKTHPAKKILIAVDESLNSSRAVDYVARILGSYRDVSCELLHVMQEPEEDFFLTREDRDKWFDGQRAKMEGILEESRERLIRAGFAANRVRTRLSVRRCPTVSGCILDETADEGFDALVLGRKGVSAKEEFLFGSVSSGIIRHAKRMAVWVVN
jgi:nucleotide-binding universal stress UspA family protein